MLGRVAYSLSKLRDKSILFWVLSSIAENVETTPSIHPSIFNAFVNFPLPIMRKAGECLWSHTMLRRYVSKITLAEVIFIVEFRRQRQQKLYSLSSFEDNECQWRLYSLSSFEDNECQLWSYEYNAGECYIHCRVVKITSAENVYCRVRLWRTIFVHRKWSAMKYRSHTNILWRQNVGYKWFSVYSV